MEPSEILDSIDMDLSPFDKLNISENWKMLHDIKERSICEGCQRSRKYFCYSCYKPVNSISMITPKLQLPIKIDIIKHQKEIDGKSTSIHAAVIAPDDVTIYTYPCIPDYCNSLNVVLVFPGKNAKSFADYMQEISNDTKEYKIEKVVFIDSTWHQCKGIYKDPRLKKLPCIILTARLSQYWRHQKGSPRSHLATIEAIHQFLIEFISCKAMDYTVMKFNEDKFKSYNGQYDNLLFFFRFMYDKIHNLYEHNKLLSYKRPVNV